MIVEIINLQRDRLTVIASMLWPGNLYS